MIDHGAIDRLVADLGGDHATVAEILSMFLVEAPTNLSDLRAAVERRDLEVTLRTAHTLKSTSAQFGAMGVSNKAKEIELGARDGRLPEAGALAELEAQWNAAREELSREHTKMVTH